jgi:hypothetical protein
VKKMACQLLRPNGILSNTSNWLENRTLSDMKQIQKLAILAGAVLAVALVAQQVQANQITGSVNMSGGLTLGVGSAGNSLNTASEVFSFGATTVSSGTQTYSATSGATVTWSGLPLLFATGAQSKSDLWSFTSSGKTYTFSLASISSWTVNAGDTQGLLSGLGTLDATGYSTTPGNFTLTITDSSGGSSAQATFGFGASNTALPDGGLTASLLGGAFLGLAALRRKLSR